MDVERIVFRLIADASSYFNVLDSAQSRLLFFASFMTEHMGRAALQMAAEFEQASISFEVMTGSAELAYSILKDISDLALRTPFSFSELVASAKQVKAFGFDLADITTVLSRLGDVSAGTGVDINRIILAFGQVRTTGRLMGQELRQFANAGIPILDYLARVMGRSVSQIPQLVRQGRVSFATVAAAFNEMTKEGGLFGGMMERVTAETLGGRWQNFVESLKMATRDWGLMAVQVFRIKDGLTGLANFFQGANSPAGLERVKDLFDQINAVVQLVWFGIKGTWAFLVRLYEQNQRVVHTALALLGIILAWKIAVAAVVGTIALIMSPLGQLVVVAGAFAWLLDSFTVLEKSVGRIVELFRLLGAEFKEAWAGIVGAVKGGDVELAFELAIATFKVAWKGLLHQLEAEWSYFWADVGTSAVYKAVGVIYEILGRTVARLQQTLGATDAAEATRRTMTENLAQLQREREAHARRQAGEVPTAAQTAAFVRGLPEFRQMQQLSEQGRLTGLLGRELLATVRAINTERGRFDIQPGDQAGLLNRMTRRLDLAPGVGGLLGGAAAEGLQQQYQDLLLELGNQFASLENMQRRMTEGRQVFIDGQFRVPTDADLRTQADRIKASWTELNRFTEAVTANGRAAAEARRRLPEPLEVSIGAQRAAQELERIFAEGVGPLDKFRHSVANIEEAFAGPIPEALMGVLPAAAVMGVRTFGGLINEKMRDEGLFRAYEEFRRSLPNEVERRPGAFLAGSREAQEVINRAQGQTTDVQQQIKAEIQLGNHLAQEAARHRAQVVAALQNLAAQGGGVVGRRVDGGGND